MRHGTSFAQYTKGHGNDFFLSGGNHGEFKYLTIDYSHSFYFSGHLDHFGPIGGVFCAKAVSSFHSFLQPHCL